MRIVGVFTKQQIIDLILSNLATAGTLYQDEMEGAKEELDTVPNAELVPVLMESIRVLAESGQSCAVSIIPIGEISLN